jgi:hypothetical protein
MIGLTFAAAFDLLEQLKTIVLFAVQSRRLADVPLHPEVSSGRSYQTLEKHPKKESTKHHRKHETK